MAVFLRKAKRAMEVGGPTKVATYKPPTYLYRDTGEYSELKVTKLEAIPRIGTKSIDYTAMVKSESFAGRDKNGNKISSKQKKNLKPAYKVTIKFLRISYKDDQTPSHDVEATMDGASGDIVKFFKEPIFSKNPVQLKCQCTDFRFKFQWDLAQHGGLIGRKSPYDRITVEPTIANMKKWDAWENDKTGKIPQPFEKKPRPYANPTGKIGYCKHIHSVLVELKEKGWVTEK